LSDELSKVLFYLLSNLLDYAHSITQDVFATASKIFIVLELVEGGELFEHLVEKKVLPEDEARFFFHQLIDGLVYCQKAGICHRDLKPENLLLDKRGNLKISDFGLSTLYVGDAEAEGQQRAELLHTTCGTPNYVAPEVLESRGYDGKSADVWSVGVILFVLLAGYLPFEEETMPALFSKIKRADFAYPMWFSPTSKALLSGILVPNPAARFTLTDVFNHPWMQGPKTPPIAKVKMERSGSDLEMPPPPSSSLLPSLPIAPSNSSDSSTSEFKNLEDHRHDADAVQKSCLTNDFATREVASVPPEPPPTPSAPEPSITTNIAKKSSCLPFICGGTLSVAD